MPCLFERKFDGHNKATLLPSVTPGCEWVLGGEGVATYQWDGTACLVRGGVLFKRFDAKGGKPRPEGWEACQPEPDPITGHWPGWVPVGEEPDSRWHREVWAPHQALADEVGAHLPDGTYELVGPRVQGNPHKLGRLSLQLHGDFVAEPPKSFEGLRAFLATFDGEGLVFHHPDGRMCKLRRADFGYPWPIQSREEPTS